MVKCNFVVDMEVYYCLEVDIINSIETQENKENKNSQESNLLDLEQSISSWMFTNFEFKPTMKSQKIMDH